MHDEKKVYIFSGLLLVTALFFFTPLKAAESIPATDTGQDSYQVTCTGTGVYGNGTVNTYDANGSFNSWYVPCANGTAKQGPFEVSIYTYVFDKIGAGGQTSLNINGGGTYARFSRTLTSNGSDAGFSAYHSTGNYTVQITPVYECTNPDYPILNGNQCEANPEPEPCSFDMPTYIAPSYLPHNRICVQNPDMNNSCSYTATTESTGQNNGVVFTATSESCGCDSLSATPCTSLNDSLGTPNPDADNCTEIGGMNWCAADPQERCQDSAGYTQCDTNCGYINEVFMCGDETLPDASACISGDTRAICIGVPEGQCPTGYDCSGTHDQTPEPPEPCLLNDPRPECQGVPEGGSPNITPIDVDLSNVEALLRQGNMNTNQIAEILKGEGEQFNAAELADIAQAREDYLADLASTPTEQSAFIDSINATGTFFGSFITDVVPQPNPSCQPYNLGLTDQIPITIDICEVAPLIRTFIAWILNLGAVFYLFNAAITRTSPQVNTAGIHSGS